jgi:hypothetical protein
MYFVPSKQQELNFKELTIGQLKEIYFFNNTMKNSTGFNYGFIKTLLQNNDTTLTSFDKEILFLQIVQKELRKKDIINNTISHPQPVEVKEGIYQLTVSFPLITHELEICSIISNFKKIDKNILLLIEITKYIDSIFINNTQIDSNVTFDKKVNLVKQLPPYILATCIKLIDQSKRTIKNYYTTNNLTYSYDISLLVP